MKTTRFGIATLIFGLYATGSAWIISGEGENYRKNLRERFIAKTEPTPTPSKSEPDTSVTMPMPSEDHRATPVETPKPPVLTSAIPTKPMPTPPLSAERSTTVPAGDGQKPPPVPVADPFWDLPEQKKVWDLDHLTAEDEQRLGADINRVILHFHKPVSSGPLPGRLADAAERYVPKGASYKFTVLDCDESNVFSHPGGYIYACRGLFAWNSEEEDYTLEFIVAHEIAHLEKAHALSCLRDPKVKKTGIGTVPLFYHLLIPWGYREEQDFEADRLAVQRLTQAGHSRHETMAFLRKLEDFSRKNEFETIRKKPTDDPNLDPLDNHLRAHPIVRDRLKRVKSQLDPLAKPK